ncbi:MAG TPA: hypothetical protein DD473_11125 [Planctomycetaceae bacterium]|nr:hypothetical protein [Planctomycetaceae bacterium]
MFFIPNPLACFCLTTLILSGFNQGSVLGQLPVTQLGSVFPPGGTIGSEFEVNVLDGTDLDELSGLVFSSPGIEQIDHPDAHSNPRKFRVKIAPNVPAGYHSVRAEGRFGVSNARMFRVEQIPVQALQESDWKNQEPVAIELNTAYYSRCEGGGDIDEFQVELPQNQQIQLRVNCLDLDSRMNPAVEVYSPDGHRIAFARRVGDQDPLLNFTTSQAGPYKIRIYDFLFQNSNAHIYRLEVADWKIPSQIQPPVLSTSTEAKFQGILTQDKPESVELQNLTIDSGHPLLSGFINPRELMVTRQVLRLSPQDQHSFLTSLPVIDTAIQLETEPNNEVAQSQLVPLPVDVTGQFEDANDIDRYVFDIKKGQAIWLQVFAERDGKILDPFVQLDHVSKDDKGNEIVKSIPVPDDLTANLIPNVFDTLTDDIDFTTVAPEDGQFRVSIRNRYAVTGKRKVSPYRLHISTPQPEFQVYAFTHPHVVGTTTIDTPSGCIMRRGGTTSLQVIVNRIQGFDQGVIVEAPHPPPGVQIPAILIPPGEQTGELILYSSEDAPAGFSELQLTAKPFDPSLKEQPDAELKSVRVLPVSIAWKAAANMPAVSRQGHSLVVTVLNETDSIQPALTQPQLFQHVCQSQLFWHPLQVKRLAGFADKVTLKADGLDKNAKITATTPEIPKEASESSIHFQFATDAKIGWHTCSIHGETQVNYVRNPELVARTQKQYDDANTTLEADKKEQTTIDQLVKKLDADLKANAAEKAKLQAEIKKQEETSVRLKKELTDLETQLAAATEEAAKTPLMDSIKQKQDEITKSESDKSNLMKQVQELDKTAQITQQELTTQQKKLTDTQARVKTNQTNLDGLKKTLDKVKSDQKPKALKQDELFDRLVFLVHKAPLSLAVKSGKDVAIKRGESQEIEVEIKREGEQKYPVDLTATIPPGVSGISWETVSLSPEENTAKLKLTASPEATVGSHSLSTVRVSTQQEGQTLHIDATVTIKVE